ncbi:MAG: ABC transporter permease [Acidobacteriota bacterium]
MKAPLPTSVKGNMQTIWQDVRYGMRMLLKRPGFTTISVLTLALGIGATTAVFSVVQAVLLQPLPYRGIDGLVVLWGDMPARGENRIQVSATDVHDWRRQNSVFEEVTTFANWSATLSDQGEPERVLAMQVGDGYFRLMGGIPMLGRVFVPEEQEEGKDSVIVLSWELWKRRFSGDSNVVGRSILLSSRPYTIVGVMPRDFYSLPQNLVDGPIELYRPVAEPFDESQRSSRHLRAIARLKDGVTSAQAQTEMTHIAGRMAQEHAKDSTGYGVRVLGLTEEIVGKLRRTLLLLLLAVLLVLTIGCANVGNLLLARAAERQREIALRAALGAGRWRLARQLLTESLLLSTGGGVLGLLFAMWGVSALATLGAQFIPDLNPVQIDGQVLVFTLTVSAIAGLVFGLAPAIQFTRPDLIEALKEGGRSSTTSFSQRRIQGGIVVAEVALALILLVAAGLLMRTMRNLYQESPGFNTENLLTMNVWLPQAKYQDPSKWIAFYEQLQSRVAALTGVKSVAFTSVLPMSQNFDRRAFLIETRPVTRGQEASADTYFVTPHYFETLEIPIRFGRPLKSEDGERNDPVVVVNETFARRNWPGEDALGKRIRLPGSGRGPERWRTVVGVAGDIKHYGVDLQPTLQVYLPETQFPVSTLTLVARTVGEPGAMVDAVRGQVRVIDPGQSVFQVASMDDLLARKVSMRNFLMWLFGAFAGLALVLAATGIYGLMSYSVTQRTHEIGIRMALGATVTDVLVMVIGRGVRLSLLGVAAGWVGAIVATRLLQGLLFGIGPGDPWTFACVSALLVSIAIIACYIPARRAQRVDPMVALRYD